MLRFVTVLARSGVSRRSRSEEGSRRAPHPLYNRGLAPRRRRLFAIKIVLFRSECQSKTNQSATTGCVSACCRCSSLSAACCTETATRRTLSTSTCRCEGVALLQRSKPKRPPPPQERGAPREGRALHEGVHDPAQITVRDRLDGCEPCDVGTFRHSCTNSAVSGASAYRR
jgi:hypothetical protein